ncbi:rRNA-processing arch domain-containing protein [Armillaria borealis]|uniref:rRNA-processing arch domain-containing protein n=1 Tax=Armillaria borealis TaxID=47425 RepID=A0AA39MQS9_9AGAR|nr:rRNA-processing arch domain-containing protein [Armillaria borealis]
MILKPRQGGVAASAGLDNAFETGGGLELKHQVRHQVAVPPGYNYIPISQHVPPAKPHREYKFELDPFQKVSIHAIQRNESVLVSAHTSAGKMAVAKYAIAQSLARKQRVIYTSLIKALSNQKYREMLAEFGDVGLVTGDVTINPSVTCLVMTTEILRSMLYRSSEVMREVAWVIFDKIHYMRDKERGVVWEETIILLPHFAEWICNSHDQPCHVVYTDFRPTPLQHYLFPAGGEGIYMVVNEKGEFKESNFTKAMGLLQHELGEDPADPKSRRAKKEKSYKGGNKKQSSDISRLVQMIMQKNCNPVIVFSFSKRECERNTLEMVKFKFSSVEEEDLTANIFNSAIDNLSVEDRQLPQITDFLSLLKRGIGIHHSSLLPILKEVIETLFQEGLIKVLFATETFSIGLNMPAKTVVFTGTTKWDGKERGSLSSREYIQMSGRAGRRGLDERRIVIMMCDEKIAGQADRLDSAFRVGYNMVLNLMKVEGFSLEHLLHSAKIPGLEEELRKEDEAMAIIAVIAHPAYSLPFLKPGQLLKVQLEKLDFSWGVVINCKKVNPPKNRSIPVLDELPPYGQYIVDVLAAGSAISKDRSMSTATPRKILPCTPGQKGVTLIVPILLSAIEGISSLRIYLPQYLTQSQQRETVWKSVLETHRRFPDGVPLLDPLRDMGIKDEKFAILVKKIKVMEDAMFKSPLHSDPRLPELYSAYAKKMAVREWIRSLKKQIQVSQDALQLDELKSRKRVLRRLGFTTSAEIVDVKGRVACELSSGDELLLTQLIFNGIFNTLSPEQCAALLSCFVFDEESKRQTKARAEFAAPLRVMHEVARRIAKVSKESKLPIREDDYVASFKVELMDTVMQWCKGASFQDIKKLTADIFEGSIIRVFRRLGELLRQMASAAKVIGNAELQEKFQKSLEILERPGSVIFRPSLYL